ncbi:hypothetical protein [Spirosoma sp. KUDC1026]|uniref:hypothetical protein n=1 Tax=Spirosoma sp. KUDC1026 TaxID=2745947 RepID=UPI00159BA8EB|nr:hypothetical protein [Spirosoma sp. KUDC1026]QKZ13448.1 hypothetical protein HU175_12710 [Spirosoma sp. KUDC1026]
MAVCDVKKNSLSQYIAASTFTHCFDGWNYVARGVESLINGDIGSCIHFLYYSELRAVMSIMACEGIGVFGKRHFYFNNSEDANFINGTTHVAAKELIESWSTLDKKQTFFNVIKLNGHTLENIAVAAGVSANSAYRSTILRDWLSKWSVDLKLSEDQTLRNEMSYRPHFSQEKVDSTDLLNKLVTIWQSLEPSTVANFSELDRHLVRITLEVMYSMRTGKTPVGPKYIKFVKDVLQEIGEGKNKVLVKFLVREIIPDDHFILTEAHKASLDNRIILNDPVPMLCRSILLLRLASGSVNSIFSKCYINSNDLRFWWNSISLKQGIINDLDPDMETNDLYSDIRDSIDSIEDKVEMGNSVKKNLDTISSEINIIKQFQRTCFWGIGL